MSAAQSGRVGSRCQSASASPATPDAPAIRDGAGSGARGGPAARSCRQNGVNTWNGRPLPVRSALGSCRRFAANDFTSVPSAARRAVTVLIDRRARGVVAAVHEER